MKLVTVTMLVSLLWPSLKAAETQRKRDTAFYLAFPEHPPSYKQDLVQLSLFISNPNTYNVTVTVTFPKMTSEQSLTPTVDPLQTWHVKVNSGLQLKGSREHEKGVVVFADDEVEVLAMTEYSTGIQSMGNYYVFARETLSQNYVIVTFCEFANQCFFAVIITEMDTHITIHLRTPVNVTIYFQGVLYTDNDVIEVGGEIGDVHQILCSKCDLSGTLIQSTRDVAVLVGGHFSRLNGAGMELLLKQLPPWESTGCYYVLDGDLQLMHPNFTELVKIVTYQAGTVFLFEGNQYVSVRERQNFTFSRHSSNIAVIQASLPVLVVRNLEPENIGYGLMEVALPVSAWATQYSMFVNGQHFDSVHLTIIAEAVAMPSISFNTTSAQTTFINNMPGGKGLTSEEYTSVTTTLPTNVSYRLSIHCRTTTGTSCFFHGYLTVDEQSRTGSVFLVPGNVTEMKEDRCLSTAITPMVSSTTLTMQDSSVPAEVTTTERESRMAMTTKVNELNNIGPDTSTENTSATNGNLSILESSTSPSEVSISDSTTAKIKSIARKDSINTDPKKTQSNGTPTSTTRSNGMNIGKTSPYNLFAQDLFIDNKQLVFEPAESTSSSTTPNHRFTVSETRSATAAGSHTPGSGVGNTDTYTAYNEKDFPTVSETPNSGTGIKNTGKVSSTSRPTRPPFTRYTSSKVHDINTTTNSYTIMPDNPSSPPNQNYSRCRCRCNANLTIDERDRLRARIRKHLTVNKSTLPCTIRNKCSHPDSRTSAVSVGIIAIGFMVTVVGIIVSADLLPLCKGKTTTKKNLSSS